MQFDISMSPDISDASHDASLHTAVVYSYRYIIAYALCVDNWPTQDGCLTVTVTAVHCTAHNENLHV